MTHKPLISIIVPAYNSVNTLKATVTSIIDQDYENWELLIVNDGSNDGTGKLVKSFLNDSRIKLFDQKNQGVAIARNTGILNSNGEYLAFLDADDIWHPQKLNKQINYYNKNPELALVHTRTTIFNDLLDDGHLNNYVEPFAVETDYYRLLISDFITTSSVMLKKSNIGIDISFNSDYIGTEDWDLWIRIAENGKIGYIEEPLVYYREHQSGISKNHTRQLHNDYLVREANVFKNQKIPRKVKRMSMWMLQKKSIFAAYNCKSKLGFFKEYLIMVYKFPLFAETYKFPFKYFLKNYL